MSVRTSVDSDGDVVLENLSFTSRLSAAGRGAAADLESMAQVIVGTGHRSGVGGPQGASHEGEEEAGVDEKATTMDIVRKFFFVGYPLTLSSLAQFSLNLMIIMVVGRLLDIEAMGGASLALGLVNATGFAFGAGLCGALETVLSHSFGHFRLEEDKRLEQAKAAAEQAGHTMAPLEPHTLHIYGIYAQRMTIILLVAAVPLGVVLCFADGFLTAVGESASVVRYTGWWCRWGLFGIPATMAFQLIQRYYSCQHLTKPLPVALIAAAIANPILQYIFVKLFGFTGSPIAWLILMSSTVAGLIFYLRFTGVYKQTWGGWDIRCTHNLGSLVSIALPSMGMMLSEWVALEINALAGGYGTPAELGAYTITLQVFGIMWAMASGVMILTCVFVGNAIGEGKPLLARRVTFTAVGVVLCVAVFDVVLCYLLEPYIPALFVKEEELAAVVPIYQELMWIVMPYHFFDVFQSTVMGALRGCELQVLGAIIITVGFCVVGVPLSFLLFFHFKIGIRALWIGPFVGVGGVGAPIYIYILLRHIKWEDLRPHSDTQAAPPLLREMAPEGADHHNEAAVDADPAASRAVIGRTAEQVAAVRQFIDTATTSETARRLASADQLSKDRAP